MAAPGDEEPIGLRDRYFRERRMLLIVSTALLAHQILGISVARSADALGLHFEITDLGRLWWAVWAIWVWCLFCCAQQLYSLRPYIGYPIERRNGIWRDLQRHLGRFMIRHAVRASYRRQVERANRVSCSVSIPVRHASSPGGDWLTSTVELHWRDTPANARATKLLDAKAVGASKRWSIQPGGDGIEDGVFYNSGRVGVRPPAPRFIMFVASAWIWMFTSFASDYVLPMAIGVSPLIIKIAGLERPQEVQNSDPSGDGPG